MADVVPVVVVRWGQTFYVVDQTHYTSQVETEAHAYARFPFTGPPVKGNPEAWQAFTAARATSQTVARR